MREIINAAVAGFGFELVLAIAVAGFEVSAFVLDPELGTAARFFLALGVCRASQCNGGCI